MEPARSAEREPLPDRSAANNRRARTTVFVVTWIAYASSYLARKNFSVVKVRLRAQFRFDNAQLAGIETGYLLAYAIGQFLCGPLADRKGGRVLVASGLLVAAVASGVFGAASAWPLFAIAFVVNGLGQSAGWPGNNRVLQRWTTVRDRGAVMGAWATCYQVGGIAATVLATWLLAHAGWRSAFVVPALWMAIVACVVVGTVVEPAAGAGIELASGAAVVSAREPVEPHRPLRSNPALWCFGGSYFCIKLVRYSLLFWLPLYFHDARHFGETAAGYLSTALEVGGTAGAIGFGAWSDRVPHARARVAATGLVALAGALALFEASAGFGAIAQLAALALVGAMLFGPDALVSGAAAQELGGARDAAAAVGIVNGIGSLGAVAQGPVTEHVSRLFGWNAVFRVFLALAIVGALLLFASPRSRRAHPA